jgi:hypothetical protein
MLVTASLIFAVGCSNGEAQEDESNGAVPVEIYACTYNEGQGPADLDAATAKWNTWADSRGLSDYSAWTLTKFFASDNQDFDFAWLGASPTGEALGAAQDDWLTNGGEINAEFEKVADCGGHSGFASIQFKEAAEREDMSTSVVTFSDCVIGEDKSFTDDVAPALTAWSEFRTAQGSKAGYFVLFPVYGGGGEEFDFKLVTVHANHAERGVDFDNYDPAKARELFPQGMVECDSARVYNSTNRRRGTQPE